jgi:general secretion pathway protein M
MSLRTNITNQLRRPVAYFAREWNRMAPRERRLVGILGGAVLAVLVVVVTMLTAQRLGEIKDTNEASREALSEIAKHRDDFLDAQARMKAQELRIGNEPVQLAADLEAAAHEVGIQIPETVDRPPVPAGKRYMEHNADVTLRQVDLLSLTKFLAKLETNRRLIVITKMNIKRAFTDVEKGVKLNVTLTATAYERVAEDKGKKKPGGPGGKEHL